MKWDTKLLVVSMLTYLVFALFNLFGQIQGFVGPVPLTVFYVPFVGLLFSFTIKPSVLAIPLYVFTAGTIGLLLSLIQESPTQEVIFLIGALYVSVLLFIGMLIYRMTKTNNLNKWLQIIFIAFSVMFAVQTIVELINSSNPEDYRAPAILTCITGCLAASALIIDRSVQQLNIAEKRMFIIITLFIYFQVMNWLSVVLSTPQPINPELIN